MSSHSPSPLSSSPPIPIPPHTLPSKGSRSAMDSKHSRRKTLSSVSRELSSRVSTLEQNDFRDMRRQIQNLTQQYMEEKARASSAEQRLLDILGKFTDVNHERLIALQEASALREELNLYKIQYGAAQNEVHKAQKVVDRLEKDKTDIEERMAEARSMIRNLKDERLIQIARQQGRAEGYREGLERGGYFTGVPHPMTETGHTFSYVPSEAQHGPVIHDDNEDDGISSRRSSPVQEPRMATPGPSFRAPEAAPSVRRTSISEPPTDDPIRPILLHNRTPSPSHPPVNLPPDNFIPSVDDDLRIRLPPPHEFMRATPAISERPASPALPVLEPSFRRDRPASPASMKSGRKSTRAPSVASSAFQQRETRTYHPEPDVASAAAFSEGYGSRQRSSRAPSVASTTVSRSQRTERDVPRTNAEAHNYAPPPSTFYAPPQSYQPAPTSSAPAQSYYAPSRSYTPPSHPKTPSAPLSSQQPYSSAQIQEHISMSAPPQPPIIVGPSMFSDHGPSYPSSGGPANPGGASTNFYGPGHSGLSTPNTSGYPASHSMDDYVTKMRPSIDPSGGQSVMTPSPLGSQDSLFKHDESPDNIKIEILPPSLPGSKLTSPAEGQFNSMDGQTPPRDRDFLSPADALRQTPLPPQQPQPQPQPQPQSQQPSSAYIPEPPPIILSAPPPGFVPTTFTPSPAAKPDLPSTGGAYGSFAQEEYTGPPVIPSLNIGDPDPESDDDVVSSRMSSTMSGFTTPRTKTPGGLSTLSGSTTAVPIPPPSVGASTATAKPKKKGKKR